MEEGVELVPNTIEIKPQCRAAGLDRTIKALTVGIGTWGQRVMITWSSLSQYGFSGGTKPLTSSTAKPSERNYGVSPGREK